MPTVERFLLLLRPIQSDRNHGVDFSLADPRLGSDVRDLDPRRVVHLSLPQLSFDLQAIRFSVQLRLRHVRLLLRLIRLDLLLKLSPSRLHLLHLPRQLLDLALEDLRRLHPVLWLPETGILHVAVFHSEFSGFSHSRSILILQEHGRENDTQLRIRFHDRGKLRRALLKPRVEALPDGHRNAVIALRVVVKLSRTLRLHCRSLTVWRGCYGLWAPGLLVLHDYSQGDRKSTRLNSSHS